MTNTRMDEELLTALLLNARLMRWNDRELVQAAFQHGVLEGRCQGAEHLRGVIAETLGWGKLK